MDYLLLFVPFFVLCASYLVACICLHCCAMFCGQKTRTQQQSRVCVGSRTRPSLQAEPTIYVSPANLPPPPKYEALAPPSYEEVMSVAYPVQGIQQQPGQQPIVYPITHAVAQPSTNRSEDSQNTSPSTVVTVTSDVRRTSVTVATT
ncbi:uncharacterized protein LOC128680740 isoform X7 [Plodia interpunctella]|uniref:uncharacterized protein LOC128680740 isoform X7 n=1 Tax=Plodia interpunctella TaxID=58824 RepID=UPI002368A10F|nr:uncharacterized protein LOC128680740 isoform X7 [Plodia interpunctella]XP_053620081.1 uncharacterized protein LOC128680740 isoform X7 [Plodia interpunctella]